MPSSRFNRIVLLGSVTTFLFLAGYRLNDMWLPAGNSDLACAGAQYHAIARHQLKHGLFRTRFAQFRVYHPIDDDEIFTTGGDFKGESLRKKYNDRFWVSRLPFGALLHTFSLWLFSDAEKEYTGEISQEWAIRLVPYLATLLLILALYVMLKDNYGESIAVWCAAILALCPATILHARLAGYEMPCLLLITMAFILWDRFRSNQTKYGFGKVWLTALAAGLMGWFGLYVIVIMLVESFRLCESTNVTWKQRIALLAIPLIVGGLYILYMHALGQPVTERINYFWQARSVGGTEVSDGSLSFSSSVMNDKFGATEYLYTIQKFFVNHLTPIPLLLAVVWLGSYIFSYRKSPLQEQRLIFMLGAFALMCYVITLKSSYVHRYYIIWWLPVIAAASGAVIGRWLDKDKMENTI